MAFWYGDAMSQPQREDFAFPPGEYLEEELQARGWSVEELAERMGGERDYAVNLLSAMMLIAVHDTHLILDRETAEGFARALGTSPEVWLNLDAHWRQHGPPSRYATKH